MECSPTLISLVFCLILIVAVPVNYGMLSYFSLKPRKIHFWVAVPVNYGMLSYQKQNAMKHSTKVAVPVNYGMLSYLET